MGKTLNIDSLNFRVWEHPHVRGWNFLRIGTVILIYGDAGFLTHRDGYRKTIFLKYRDA